MEVYDIFLERLPKIDLHGFDRESARVAVNDFVKEALVMKYSEILIIHGIGSGVVKEAVQMALAKNPYVSRYHIHGFNVGCTVVYLNLNNSK